MGKRSYAMIQGSGIWAVVGTQIGEEEQAPPFGFDQHRLVAARVAGSMKKADAGDDLLLPFD